MQVARLPRRNLRLLRQWFEMGFESGPADACWPWKGLSQHVYAGRLNDKPISIPPYRASLILHQGLKGLPPRDIPACHLCANGSLGQTCVNPAHLYWGTPQSNVMDRLGTPHNLIKKSFQMPILFY